MPSITAAAVRKTALMALLCGALDVAASAPALAASADAVASTIRADLATANDRVDVIDDRMSLYRRAVGNPSGSAAPSGRSAGAVFTHLLVSDPSKPSSVYLRGSGIQGFRDASGDQTGLKFNDFMVWAGADRRFGQNWLVGAALGYGGGQSKSSGEVVTADRTTQAATLYGAFEKGRLFVNADAFWGWDRFDHLSRQTDVGSLATGKANGTSWGGGVTSGVMFGWGPTRLGPIVGLHAAGAHIDSFNEGGAGAADNYSWHDQEATLLTSQIGGEIQYNAVPSGMLAPRLRLVWDRQLAEDRRDVAGHLTANPSITQTVSGVKEQADRVRMRVGVGGSFARGLSAGVDYEAAVGGGFDQRLSAEMHLAF